MIFCLNVIYFKMNLKPKFYKRDVVCRIRRFFYSGVWLGLGVCASSWVFVELLSALSRVELVFAGELLSQGFWLELEFLILQRFLLNCRVFAALTLNCRGHV
jgi:hypothetical protein